MVTLVQEFEDQIERGELNITQVSDVATFLKQEERGTAATKTTAFATA
jgi:hypothetical protein